MHLVDLGFVYMSYLSTGMWYSRLFPVSNSGTNLINIYEVMHALSSDPVSFCSCLAGQWVTRHPSIISPAIQLAWAPIQLGYYTRDLEMSCF